MSAPADSGRAAEPGLLGRMRFGADGLIAVVVQASAGGQVLLAGSMNREALARTLAEGRLWLWSRSRGRLWLKGETSGNFQQVDAIYVNCELNSLLVQVTSRGPICHTGQPTCFYRRAGADGTLEPAAATPDHGPAGRTRARIDRPPAA